MKLILAITWILGGTLSGVPPSTRQAQTGAAKPAMIQLSSSAPDANVQLSALVAEIRKEADAFIFLSGGASKMQEDRKRQLLTIFDALSLLVKNGRRIAVGDGGTKAGIMEAAGLARKASGNTFPLIGVAPAAEIPPHGRTRVDPNHSHIVAVDNPTAGRENTWGSETATMYWLFGRLAEGRPSVTIVANGGTITLNEVEANVHAGRRMLLIDGSGRAADALVALLRKTTPSDPEVRRLSARADEAGLTRRPELFQIVPLQAGATGLRDAITEAIADANQR
jgi:hypothetical protein